MLAPLGGLYGASIAWKAQKTQPYRAGIKVVCVGNLTAGGSGKTPVAMALAQILLAQDKKTFFVTRGYGGSTSGPTEVTAISTAAEMGDEALLLARVAPTIVAHDRAQGAILAVARGAEVIVMDDGHQNFTLAKDLSLIVVDGQSGFGNGLMIPAGPLREPVAQGLSRADAVIIVGHGTPDLQGYTGPVVRAQMTPRQNALRGQRVFAFAGIGRPEKFASSLKEAGANVIGTQFFADHHVFRADEIKNLRRRAAGAQLITTEKDYVRLSAAQREGVAVLEVGISFGDDMAPLLNRLFP